MVKLSLSLLLWSTVWISTESSTSCVNLKRFNFTNCDKDDLRTEELTHVLHKAARIISYETSTQCNDPTHCSNDSPGTGHTLASGENGGPSVQNTISVERCYSYCLKFANLLDDPSTTGPFPNLYSEDACGSYNKVLVCIPLCYIKQTRAPFSCSQLCQISCERALSTNADCLPECKNSTCPDICSDLDDNFPLHYNQSSSKLNSLRPFTVELDYFSDNKTFWKLGALEPKWTIITPPPPLAGIFTIISSNHGIIWKIEVPEKGTRYVAQHEPFTKTLTGFSPLYGINSNILSIRELQCKKGANLSYALVDKDGISKFLQLSPQCFYGTWTPTPPREIRAKLRFSNITGELIFEVWTDDLSPDQEDVTGYGIQIVSAPSDFNKCLGPYIKIKSFESHNKTAVHLFVNGTDNVLQYFPVIHDQGVCNYLIGVYALPHFDTSSRTSTKYAAANWFNASIEVPDSRSPQLNLTHVVKRNHVTGQATVIVNNHFTSHWKSMALVERLQPSFTLEADGSVASILFFYPKNIAITNVKVKPSVRDYTLVYEDIPPPDTMRKEYLTYKYNLLSRYNGTAFDNHQSLPIRIPALQPSEPRNLTVNSIVFDFERVEFYLNISWKGPDFPEGKIKQYFLVINSESAIAIIDEKIEVAGTSAEKDMDEVITISTQGAIITENDHMNITLRALSEYDATGEVLIETILIPQRQEQSTETKTWVYGIVGGIAAFFVVLLFVIIGLIVLYYYKKNKVVIMKNTGIWLNGQQEDGLVVEGEDGTFEPLQLDNWEISPDQIIMDCMLGEGAFGEVYKGLIKGAVNNQYFSGIDNFTVAVKILREEASAALKSDFLKEIATMKKITMGSCPYVVNMVGCCTLQEPLALVLEYVPHGDLLTYLRTVRKLNNSSYFNMPESVQDIKGNEYVNHSGSGNPSVTPMTPMTPMTPASDCPLLGEREKKTSSPSSPQGQVPSPYEKPFSALGELRPIHLVSFAYQIASGMKFLSEMGMVHRDLACRNILVGENKALKISDFGLTRENDVYIKTTDGKLPLRWMAIESIVDRVFTTKSDVWSYGVVLWEITTIGGHPYPTIGNKALLATLLRGFRMEKPENCSEEVYDIMKKCWSQEQDERPTFSELQQIFETMLSNAQNANYIDLNVDEMLPYYDMKAIDEEPEGLLEDDVLPDGSEEKEPGYPDTSEINNRNYLENIERPTSNSNSDDTSITSDSVPQLINSARNGKSTSAQDSKGDTPHHPTTLNIESVYPDVPLQ